ncbi:MotA/TolQ/ExbB proton channel family protein [Rhodohalobacter halophilus]|uniref:MotA/TolQ/ExbB proton channel family protein n=1 Tax=Rhodohalobacter halophilus TaxID=1812810 RepID=UPI00083F5DDA|nr:MotA/TolQ/ExbB proton channel family protein [Rhodohalobacter halophilus]
MTDLFFMGGPLFMGILTIILVAMVSLTCYIAIQKKKEGIKPLADSWVKELGILGLVVGIFGQFIGLYQAFSIIEEAGSVSQAMLVGGFKVSSITTLYGFVILILSLILNVGLKLLDNPNVQQGKGN